MTLVRLTDPEYDLPPFNGRSRPYVICATPRSGSALLSHLLHRTGQMGVPEEYLHPRAAMPRLAERFGIAPADQPIPLRRYLHTVVRHRTSPNGVFGIKLQFEHLRAHWGRSALFDLMRSARLVHVRRRDRTAQAVSYAIATANGEWNAARDSADDPSPQEFDAERLRDAIQRLVGQELGWATFFEVNGLRPLRVVYEDLLADPRPSCAAVCRAVGVVPPDSFPIEEVPIKRQSGPANEAWIRQVHLGLTMPRATSSRGI